MGFDQNADRTMIVWKKVVANFGRMTVLGYLLQYLVSNVGNTLFG